MPTDTSTPAFGSAWWRGWLGPAYILLLTVGAFIVAIQIWQPPAAVGGEILAHYAPLRDGDALSQVETAEGGIPISWTTINTVIIPPVDVALLSRPDEQTALFSFYGITSGNPRELIERASTDQLYFRRERELDVTGLVTNTTALWVRDATGDHLVSQYVEATGTLLTFDPAPLILPADLAPGKVWATEGKLNSADYRYKAEARTVMNGCIEVSSQFIITNRGSKLTDLTKVEQICPERGYIGAETVDHGVGTTTQSRRIDGGHSDVRLLPPAPKSLPSPSLIGDAATWVSVLFGDLNGSTRNAEATFAPVWIPSEPPLLLGGNADGDLVAFDATNPAGVVRWRFHVGGPIYAAPSYDPVNGLIIFGASDKRVYALDTYGLFRWSAATSDVVTARPLISGTTTVVVGEDRMARGFDLQTGAELWTQAVGSPVASSPALSGNLAIFGTDSGQVLALDTGSGEVRWRHALDNTAVEAAVVVSNGTAYIAARNGTIAALDAATGEERPGWAMRPIDTLRNAPAVAAGVLAVVDDYHVLHLLDLGTGVERWRTPEAASNMVGTPTIIGGEMFVPTEYGGVRRFQIDGVEQQGWAPPQPLNPRFGYSLSMGGGALWLASPIGQVLRLGQSDGVARSTPAVLLQRGDPPFLDQNAVAAVVPYGDKRVLLDWIGDGVWIAGADGAARKLAQLKGDLKLFAVDPIVAANTLLFEAEGLRALDLRTGAELWHVAGTKLYASPDVGDGHVVWVEAGETGSVTLSVADLATGKISWRQTLATLGVSGALIRDGRVYIGSPPAAFDLATGKKLWMLLETGAGSPALSADGQIIYLATQTASGETRLAARATADGAEIWHVVLPTVAAINDQIALVGDRLVVALGDGSMAAFARDGGKQLWHTMPAIDRWGATTVAGGMVWFVGGDGGVYGYRVGDGTLGALYTQRTGLMRTLSSFSFTQPASFGDRLGVGLNHLYVELPLEGQ